MFWYAYMVALEDIRMQKKGSIGIIFALGDAIRRPVDYRVFFKLRKLIDAIPMPVRGFHFCYDDQTIAQVRPNPITVIQWAMDTLTRTKFRVHYGT